MIIILMTKLFLFIAVSFNRLAYFFRNILLKTNKNLSQVLLEVLKTTAAAEETLSLHMQSLAASSGSTRPREPLRPRSNNEQINSINTGAFCHIFSVPAHIEFLSWIVQVAFLCLLFNIIYALHVQCRYWEMNRHQIHFKTTIQCYTNVAGNL